MDTVVFAIGYKTSINHSMSRNLSQTTRPPLFQTQNKVKHTTERLSEIKRKDYFAYFGRCLSWTVKDKLVSLRIKSSSCLKALNVRSMTKLGLSVATDYLHLVGKRQPLLFLFLCPLSFDCRHKHSLAATTTVLTINQTQNSAEHSNKTKKLGSVCVCVLFLPNEDPRSQVDP